MIELARAKSLSNFRECDLHRAEILQRRNLEPIRHVVAKGATQAPATLHKVVIAVFAIPQGGEAAKGSVMFDVDKFRFAFGPIPFH